ncbi:MAG: DMT family transporter [Deltaproteobacteria bacterium]|nr:DMT family transporter [Deltaproteobacteria bacterium]
MAWFWLALAAAFLLATSDFLIRRYFQGLPWGQVVLLRFAGIIPLSLAILVAAPLPRVDPAFFWAVGLALPAELTAAVLYVRAIQLSPLALTQPFMAFSPLFVVGTGYFTLGELPSPAGFLAVGLVVAGAYILNVHQAKTGVWAPLLAIRREKGSWLMLVVSLLYAYTSVLGKKAILASSPWFMAGVYPPLMGIGLVTILALRGEFPRSWPGRRGPMAALALCMTGMGVCHYWAISLAPAAYMIAVKRMSIVFAVLYGGVLLGEKRLGQHLAAAGLMAAGAGLILLWG